jgi:hypothetical protein
MANTSSYPIIAPKGGDLIVGTQTFTELDPVPDNPTRNFTVSSLVALAQNGGNVVTQKFNANWSKSAGATSPSFSATMQNSFDNTTFVLSRLGIGNYFVTASKPVFTVGKTQCFVTPGTSGAASPDFFAVIYATTQTIQIQQIDDANALSDQLWANGCLNIEVFA